MAATIATSCNGGDGPIPRSLPPPPQWQQWQRQRLPSPPRYSGHWQRWPRQRALAAAGMTTKAAAATRTSMILSALPARECALRGSALACRAESIILSAGGAESIILSTQAESIILSAGGAESMILSTCAESIMVWCMRGWVKNSENVRKFRVYSG
jgi:hypothetical protein